MNKRLFSSPLVGSRAEIFLSQESVASMQQQHTQKQLQYYKKQNYLLKKQLQQLKSIHNQQKKELNMYKSLANTNFQSKQQQNQQMIQLFQLQQNKILQLETQVEILQNQSNKLTIKTSTSSSNQYAVKCKQYQNRIITMQNQHQREVAQLKQKLMKLNATEIIMQKQRQIEKLRQKQKMSLSSLNSLPQDLKPLSRKLKTIENFN